MHLVPFLAHFDLESFCRDLFAALLQGKALGQQELKLALFLRFQGVSDLSLAEETADVKLGKTEITLEEKPSIKMESLAPRKNLVVEDHQIEIGDDLKEDPTYMPSAASYPSETGGKHVSSEERVKAHSSDHIVKEEKEGKSREVLERALCNICSKTFSNKYILKTHMLGHTDDKRPTEKLYCNICPKYFSNKYVLKNHINSHNEVRKEEEKAMCSLCSTLIKSSFLRTHTKNMHGEKKHVSCSNCGSNYRISSIIQHQRLCKYTEEEREARKAAKAKNCEKCGKVLCNIFKLRKHMEICAK